jgi:hypothetical protein
VSPNPAIQNNWCYIYLAEGCQATAQPEPEQFERIEVELRGLAEIPELIRREEIFHSLVINAFGFMGHSTRGDER